MERLTARDAHLSREDAENRVRSQTDVRLKARRSEARGPGRGVVLWNDGSRDELKAKLDKAMVELKQQSPQWWSWLLLACPPLAFAVAGWRFWENVKINQRWAAVEEAEAKKLA
jgi:dephospho-CoA kinase